MIPEEEFFKAMSSFNELEKRGSFYDIAVNLLNNYFEIEAYLMILATWNFANFRYAVMDFDISAFKEKIKELHPHFDKMKNENFRTINFYEYEENIKKIFVTLSKIKGIGYTGASKIMHLKNRNVFLLWDSYIRGSYPKKYYNELEIVKKGLWTFKNYGTAPESYIQFLKDTQELFKHINFQDNRKTFAKAIDEFYYVNITLPIKKKMKK